MTLFLSYLINGISLGSVYAIIALGYTMVYGIAKMLNFAHGDIIMVGAYVCFWAMQALGCPTIVSIVIAMVVCTVLGMLIERLAYKPLRQATSLAVLITAIGMSYLLQNIALLIWGANPKNFTSVVSIGKLSLFNGKLLITGGGAFNKFLIERIDALCPCEIVIPSRQIIEYKEALIFAFLGALYMADTPGCLASVTGATTDNIGGMLFKI